MKFNEDQFKTYIESHIQRYRPGDWNHAQRVVKWIKELCNNRKDLPILIIAGYLHDIGWRDVMSVEKVNLDNMLLLEPKANANSSTFIREVLNKYGLSNENINAVMSLVNAADAHKSQRMTKQSLLMQTI
ncbi:HD domain-containing protein [Patescibacteria group bacterium]|nr:HD domain-containing protein [Patescibacteria group bacterium]